MASLTHYPAGYSLKWHWPARTQHHVRLFGFDADSAAEAAEHVEALIRAATSRRVVGYATTRWLQTDAPANLVAALVKCGLHDDRRKMVDAVDAFLNAVDQDLSQGRADDMARELAKLVKFVGERVQVADVTRADVERWADSVSELAPSTQGKYASIVRKFFKWCEAERLIETSPAAHLNHATFAAEARREVTDLEFSALLWVVDPVSRNALELARFAGLRVSEACRLEWNRVDYSGRRMLVADTKRGRDRMVPIVDRLVLMFDRCMLEINKSSAAGKTVLHGDDFEPLTRSAIDGRIRKAAAAACVPIWPRLFHNLRATRQTEWINEFGLVNACHWIGNSQTVAARHYAMASEAALKAATKGAGDV